MSSWSVAQIDYQNHPFANSPSFGNVLEWWSTGGLVGVVHEHVILASRTSYPLVLMIGFNIFGNVLLKRESGGKGYPTWIFAWPVGLLIYTYASASFSEMVFQNISPTIFVNSQVL